MCRSRFVASAVGLVSVVGAAAPTGVADTLVPLDQERFTSVLVQSDCEGETSAGEAAAAFELFDGVVETSQQCPEVPTFASAIAHQTSTIGGSSMTLFAGAQYSVQSPGSVFASAVSTFSVTFELPRTSVLSASGILVGSGQVPGVETLLELTGAGGTVFSLTLGGPFPFGEPIEEAIQEEHTLDPGIYKVHGQALSADAFDIAEPFFSGESALNVTIEVAILGDVNGDGAVDVLDLIAMLLCFGQPADPGCEAEDINGDGVVNVLDLIDLLLAFGQPSP